LGIFNNLKKMFNKKYENILRWIDIMLLSGIVLVVLRLFEKPLLKGLDLWAKYIISLNLSLENCFFSSLLIIAIISVALIHLGSLGKYHFHSFRVLRYPPVWFSSIFVTVTSCIYCDRANMAGYCIFGLEILLGLVAGLLYYSFEIKLSDNKDKNFDFDHNNNGDLLKWVEEEKSIRNLKEDKFCHKVIADRIADLLIAESPARIGLVGSYGAGKSSIISLVKNYIKLKQTETENENIFKGKIILKNIDSWGHANGTVAQKILSISLDEIKKYVDCTSVIALPQNYHKAVSEAKIIRGSAISALLQSTKDPASQLYRLDNILVAANIKLIIVIEDLDRAANDANVKEEVPSLLDRIRNLRNVSFLFAIGTGWEFSDILKRVCDHEEDITISRDKVREIVKNFRELCLKKFPEDVNLYLKDQLDRRLGITEPQIGRTFYPVDDIYNLIDTPRLLKHILRRTYRIWEKLHGEIDFDDILVANTLRFGARDAFNFLNNYHKEIQ